jgi:hypothetical protein
MKANRRGFLGLLGIGAVSAPLAAKAAADAEIAKLTMLRNSDVLSAGSIPSNGYGAPCQSAEDYVSPYIKVDNYLKLWGKLPEFVESDLRERAKTVYHLDPDIACKRSWSLNAKIHEQRQRNYKMNIERYKITGKHELAQSAFKKLTGFEWPW